MSLTVQSTFLNASQVNPPPIMRSQKKKQGSNQSTIYHYTIAKSGTHLLTKILNLLNVNFKREENWTHLDGIANRMNENLNVEDVFPKIKKYIWLYRDPRDVVVSRIFYHREHKKYKSTEIQSYAKSQPIQKLIKEYSIDEIHSKPNPGVTHKAFQLVCKLKKNPQPNILLVSFEQLVRPQAGGNSDEARFKTFKRICDYAGVKTTTEKIQAAMKNCWGSKKGNFRAAEPKKVGQWKKYFSDENIMDFREKYNPVLLALGYETDPDWHLQYINKDRKIELV